MLASYVFFSGFFYSFFSFLFTFMLHTWVEQSDHRVASAHCVCVETRITGSEERV